MPSTKLENRILLCLVALGVGCSLGLIINRDIKKALITGAIATGASFIGGTIVDRKNLKEEKILRTSLKSKINTLNKEIARLESYEEHLRQTLTTTTTVREELELNLDELALEKNNLIEQIKQLYGQREDIEQYLPSLIREEQELQLSCNALKAELQQINYQKEEFERSLAHQQADIQENKASLTLQREEYRQLQEYITEIYHQKEQLDRDVHQLESQKKQLLGSINDLQLHISQLKAQERSLIASEQTADDDLSIQFYEEFKETPPDIDEASMDDSGEQRSDSLRDAISNRDAPRTPTASPSDFEDNLEQSAPEWAEWDELIDSI